MKAGKILLAAVLAIGFASAADAGIHVWWETSDGLQGGQGAPLQLDCQGPARCEWDLTMYISADGAGDTVLGWSEDLIWLPGLHVKNTTWNPATPWQTLYNAGYGYGPAAGGGIYGNNVLYGAYGQFAGYVPGPFIWGVLDITLSIVDPSYAPASYYWLIGSQGGGGQWVTQPPYVDFFGYYDRAGPNYYVTPYDYYPVRTNPAIVIHKVPEPGTIAFLGLGALALIRRRR